MSGLVERFNRWAAWFDQRSLRERVLLLAAVLVVGFVVSDALVFQPQGLQRRKLQGQIATLQTAVAEMEQQAELIRSGAQADPNRELRARAELLQAELSRIDEKLRELTVDLISPQEMAEVLRELLARQAGMELVRLENLPPEDLLPKTDAATMAETSEHLGLYRHPVRIVIAGTYLQALDYLRDLEHLPRKLFWDELEIAVDQYPRAEITLTVYTLSHRKGWIGV